jgi:hypothetical protein
MNPGVRACTNDSKRLEELFRHVELVRGLVCVVLDCSFDDHTSFYILHYCMDDGGGHQ